MITKDQSYCPQKAREDASILPYDETLLSAKTRSSDITMKVVPDSAPPIKFLYNHTGICNHDTKETYP